MFVWHLLNIPGKFTLPRIVVVRYINVWTDGRECTCTCVWYTRSRLHSLNVTTRYVIWFFKCNKWQYFVYFKSRRVQSVRTHKWTTFSHNNHLTNQRAPVYDAKMWILALQSPFCFTWRKVVHTAPQNSTGNEVNMGSRNSEYLNYFFFVCQNDKQLWYVL